MSASENQIVVYQPNETVRLDVRLENETVWLTQAKLGVLFGVDRTVVNRHIHNIYKTGELAETATCAKIAQVQNEGGRSITRIVPFYNLDMIIAVGYRVNSLQATRFRQWATQVLSCCFSFIFFSQSLSLKPLPFWAYEIKHLCPLFWKDFSFQPITKCVTNSVLTLKQSFLSTSSA